MFHNSNYSIIKWSKKYQLSNTGFQAWLKNKNCIQLSRNGQKSMNPTFIKLNIFWHLHEFYLNICIMQGFQVNSISLFFKWNNHSLFIISSTYTILSVFICYFTFNDNLILSEEETWKHLITHSIDPNQSSQRDKSLKQLSNNLDHATFESGWMS